MKHIPRKRFGQNFLQEEYFLKKITDYLLLHLKDFNAVEIGPGKGALTKTISDALNHLTAIELDRDLIKYLNNHLNMNKVSIINDDVLKFNFNILGDNLYIFGNLPYNISSPLLFYLTSFSNIKRLCFLLQKEVVDRICAIKNSKEYGRLSVMMQYFFTCNKIFEIPNTAFYPIPKVTSALVELIRTNNQYNADLELIVKTAFSNKRKMLTNNLKNLFTKNELGSFGNLRAEDLDLEDYLTLTKLMSKKSFISE